MPEAAAVALVVESGVDGSHDRAMIVLGPLSPWLDVAAGAAAEVALGRRRRRRAERCSPARSSGSATCRGARSSTCWQRRPRSTACASVGRTPTQTRRRHRRRPARRGWCGDRARSTPARRSAPTTSTSGGPAWRHLRALAAVLGAEVSSEPSGEVNVRAAAHRAAPTTRSGPAPSSSAGRPGRVTRPPTRCRSGPFGAASEQGSDAWSLVHHQPGGSGAHRLFPAIRDRDAASAIDEASTAAHQRRHRRRAGRHHGHAADPRRRPRRARRHRHRADGTYRVPPGPPPRRRRRLQSTLELELAS